MESVFDNEEIRHKLGKIKEIASSLEQRVEFTTKLLQDFSDRARITKTKTEEEIIRKEMIQRFADLGLGITEPKKVEADETREAGHILVAVYLDGLRIMYHLSAKDDKLKVIGYGPTDKSRHTKKAGSDKN